MTDKVTTIAEIKKHIQDFSDARGWRKNQNAKDLVMALTVEAAELAEIVYDGDYFQLKLLFIARVDYSDGTRTRG